MIPGARGFTVQAAVWPDLIVKDDPFADADTGFRAGFVAVQVHVFIFERGAVSK